MALKSLSEKIKLHSFTMKSKTKRTTRHSESMLTVRLTNKLFLSITKLAKITSLTRSELVRIILQKSVDECPSSYKL
jgi:hypothetical protein